MTTVAGAKILTGANGLFEVPDKAPNTTPAGFTWTPGPRGLYDPGTPGKLKTGAKTPAGVLNMHPYANRAGIWVQTYFDDYYNRIYLSPTSIDFSAITSDAIVVVKLWNAYIRRSVTLSSVGYDSAQGLRVEGAAPPAVISKLQEVTYNVIATAEGPAALDTLVNWVFDVPVTFVMHVIGSRVRQAGLSPAWPPTGASYQINYQFQTLVGVSRSGREQRIANRHSPRKTLTFMSHVNGDRFRALKDNMWYWQHRAFALPELTRKVDSVAAMLVGTDTMAFAAVPGWIAPGVQVILSYSGFQDIRLVLAVTDTTVQFKTQSVQLWPAGTRVYPGLTGNLDTSITAPRLTNAVATVSVVFKVSPVSERYVAPPAAATSFNGREVFLLKPNWATPVEGTFSHDVDLVDYGRGPVARFTPVAFGYETKSATYLARNAADADLLLDFFKRMRGRQGEFYMPTWEYDFQPKILANAGSLSLRVAGTDFAKFYKDSTVQKAIFAQMRSGTVQIKKVVSVQAVTDSGGSDSLITLASGWDEDVSVDTVVMCGWCPAWRLVSDELTVEWVTSSVANVQMTMMTLEDLPAETA
jgi:hypothetical protein